MGGYYALCMGVLCMGRYCAWGGDCGGREMRQKQSLACPPTPELPLRPQQIPLNDEAAPPLCRQTEALASLNLESKPRVSRPYE